MGSYKTFERCQSPMISRFARVYPTGAFRSTNRANQRIGASDFTPPDKSVEDIDALKGNTIALQVARLSKHRILADNILPNNVIKSSCLKFKALFRERNRNHSAKLRQYLLIHPHF